MAKIMILLHKEWLEFKGQRGLMLGIIALPLLLTIIPTVALIGIGYAPPDDKLDSFTQQLVAMNPALRGMSALELAQALPGQAFSSMFLLIPMMLPSIIASYSIVGEKSNRTLEPLLATPIKTWELMAGKILASLIPSMVLTWLSATIFIAAARYAAVSPRVFSTIVSPGWLTVLIACTPLLGLIAIAVMVAISARVNDPRTAQQYSAWLVVPFLAMFFSQITGLVTLSPLIGMIAAIMLAVIAGLATWGATLLFQREAILTRWS
ncbi:MAG: ABC transporter permease [Kouleothrix sp.]|jgi:ABC-2 type transport system permease protein|nr:ABC transporter permease [Kouleothrix sp.]